MQRLHLVYGGELKDPAQPEFRAVEDIHVVGIFPDYDSAYDAWKEWAMKTVDNAHMRYFLVPLRHEESPAAPKEGAG